MRGAKLRHRRGVEHINEIGATITTFETENTAPLRVIVAKNELDRGEGISPTFDWSAAKHPPTSRVGILAGESLYNLRASLDYLIYVLCFLDSGAEYKSSQFPIADSSTTFWKKDRKDRLKGVNDTHTRQIASYQPYEGHEWIRRLRDLSNSDKHKRLTAVVPQYEGNFTILREEAQPIEDDPEHLEVPMKDVKARLFFWNGLPVFETLVDIATNVGRVLEQHQSDFGETDVLTME